MTLISILTPTYNSGRFLEDALRSVRRQRGVDVQHVVVDGASTDDTVELLKHWRVDWISKPDNGQSQALSRALEMARGDIIGWLNADEFYLPSALASIVGAFDRDDTDVVYGSHVEVGEDGSFIRYVGQHGFSAYILRQMGCYIPSCATFVRRCAMGSAPWNESLHRIMDWDLWLQLDSYGARFRHVPRPLAAFRRHGDQVTAERVDARSHPEHIAVRSRYGIPPAGTMVGKLGHLSARLLRVVRKFPYEYLSELQLSLLKGQTLRWFEDPRGHWTAELLVNGVRGQDG